ncbi:MAG: GH3 auxin-responsive promoter [Bacteroidetes bacterium GWA2_30_7]|nr:MAG: GH3 auxin-responsive promoter [Bacteroidetes bacterium GWA2_30_7]
MAFIGTILQEVVMVNKLYKKSFSASTLQYNTLKKLLFKAKNTEFGLKYKFSEILKSDNIVESFQNKVPIYDYNKMLGDWWYRSKEGRVGVAWPGKVKYFGLTSGTSDAASKTVPITSDMIRAIRKTSLSQIRTLTKFNLPDSFYTKNVLMVGGSTALTKINSRLEGDLSGILMKNLPVWFQRYYKPGKRIAKMKDWSSKLEEITINAHKWDIGIIAGVPAWVQILLEKIIKHYKLNNIHELWPNFMLFVHGGVSFSPYKSSFTKLLGKEIHYLETYLASEGFIAYRHADENSMQMVLDNGIFYEFVEFNENNFSNDGNLLENPEILNIAQVKENVDYALLLTTCAGTWRYLLGDTIKFTSVKHSEIIISGRTKHFLSMCGEHLSIDNMNKAIKNVSEQLGIAINEYTVAGIKYENLFAHQWYIGSESEIDTEQFKDILDKELVKLNDDYGVERKAALKNVLIKQVPTETFYKWLKSKGREGGQNKFPRVLKNDLITDWEKFILNNQ